MASQASEFLEAMILQVTRPEDEVDTGVNGIHGSTASRAAGIIPLIISG